MTDAETRLDALEQGNGGGGGSGNDDLEQRIDNLETDLSDLSGRIEVNESDIEELKNGRESFEIGINNDISTIENKVIAAEQTINNL